MLREVEVGVASCRTKRVRNLSECGQQFVNKVFSRSLDAERGRGRRGLLSDEERKKPQ